MVDNRSIGMAIKHCSTLVRLRSGKRQPISVRLFPLTSEWKDNVPVNEAGKVANVVESCESKVTSNNHSLNWKAAIGQCGHSFGHISYINKDHFLWMVLRDVFWRVKSTPALVRMLCWPCSEFMGLFGVVNDQIQWAGSKPILSGKQNPEKH